jgi:hypothetical protein
MFFGCADPSAKRVATMIETQAEVKQLTARNHHD